MRTVFSFASLRLLALAIRLLAWNHFHPINLPWEWTKSQDITQKSIAKSDQETTKIYKDNQKYEERIRNIHQESRDMASTTHLSPGFVWIQRTIEAWVGPARFHTCSIIFTVLAGSLAPCFTWLICNRLSLPKSVAFGAGLAMAMSPPLVWASITPSNLALTTFLFNVGLFFILATTQAGTPSWAISAGITLGLTCLVESFSLIPVFSLAAGSIWLLRNKVAGWLSATFLLLALLATITPWQLHILRLHEEFLPIAGKPYALFWNGTIKDPNCKNIQDSLIQHTSTDTVSFLENPNTTELERASWFSHDGFNRISTNPGTWAATRLGSVFENMAGESGFWAPPNGPQPIPSGFLAFYLVATFFIALFGLTKLALLPKEASLIWLAFLGWVFGAFLFPFDAHLTWRTLFEPSILVLAFISLGPNPIESA
jgi:hypothetical protein